MLLAMPAIWLAWAMVAFCIAIMSYIWRTGSSDDPADGARTSLSPGQALAVRIAISAVFALGLVYFVLILRTFASYGERETGWRRSWLATGGHPRERHRHDDGRERERERGRRRERGRQEQRQETGREADVESKQSPATSPIAGLGLLGVSGSSVKGLASVTSVLADDSEGEKADVFPMRALKGKVSPKL